jgi:hypothetical protein
MTRADYHLHRAIGSVRDVVLQDKAYLALLWLVDW